MTASRTPCEIYFLDRRGTASLQAQLREAVISSIMAGQVAPRAVMPSTRKLAAHLGISRMTVTLAFQELVALGFLETRARSGFVVAEGAFEAPQAAQRATAPAPHQAIDWTRRLPRTLATRKRIAKPLDWRAFPYPFVYGQVDSTVFDHGAWRDCARQALGKRDFLSMAGDLASTDDPMLVNYIRTHTLPRRGIAARPEEILVTVGAQNGLWLAIDLLVKQGSRVVCENPGYPDTLEALRWRGADVASVDIDGAGLPPERLPNGVEAVFVTPSHHAPTGITMPRQRRLDLLARAMDRDFVIVEDDYEFEMSYLAAPAPALKSYDRAERVIYVGSFSKAVFPGLRIGYMVAPAPFIAEARELRSLVLRHPPGHLQRTTAYFLAQGHYDRLIRAMKQRLAQRRAILETALAGSVLKIAGAATFGGSSLWIEAPRAVDARALQHALLERGVVIEAGAPFFSGADAPQHFFRLGYSSIPAPAIAQGVAILIEACEGAIPA